MKYAVIILDGAPQGPLERLGGRSPLEAANVPALDGLAARGRLGTVSAGAEEEDRSEGATHLSMLGYDPSRHPAGDGALTAYARGIEVEPQDQVLCCDLVTVIDGQLRDPMAGFISAAEATPLILMLDETFRGEGFRFRVCGGYRNLCMWQNAGDLCRLRTMPPEQALDQPVKRCLPRGGSAKLLCEVMLRAESLLCDHDINLVRRDLGENPATAIWLWGQGPLPVLPSFQEKHGVRGALVTGSDVLRGVGQLIGWELPAVAGATGLPDTDCSEKGRAAVAALDGVDLACVHVRAPHALTLVGDVAGKISALEAVDREIVTPLIERLQAEPEWRMMIITTAAGGAGQHSDLGGRTMFVLAGTGIDSHRGETFDEASALEGELHPERVSDLMEYFLRR